MAISVAVLVGDAADKLVPKLIERTKALKVLNGTNLAAEMGPIVTRAAHERISGYIDLGVAEGAELVVDGRGFTLQGHENGYFVGPSLFDHVKPTMESYREEIFGPVLQIMRADSFEEALALPSRHQYGNGVAIFTQNGRAARDFAARVNVGMVGINVPIPVPVPLFSFTGSRASKLGDLGPYGKQVVLFYTQTKTVTARWFDDSTLGHGVNTTISLK